MKWYLKVWNQYSDFDGVASRQEYWMFTLFNIIFTILALVLDNLLGLTLLGTLYGLFYFFYAFAVLTPSIAVAVRRLHDVGKSGWMMLLGLIPLIGAIWLIILFASKSKLENNPYRPDSNIDSEAFVSPDEVKKDGILMAIFIYIIASRLFWFTITKVSPSFYSTGIFKPIQLISNIAFGLIPIGLAFVVKSKSKKTALLVIGGLYFAFNIIETSYRLFLH